jgi:hypothetical protein
MLTNNKKKILYDWWSGGGSQSPTLLYPSVERALKAGVGPTPLIGYVTFGGAVLLSDGTELDYWRYGSTHNTLPDADIKIFRNDNGVLSPEYIVKDHTETSKNVTSISAGEGNNGRVFVFYSLQRAANAYEVTAPSDVYYKYSDDLLDFADPNDATWSSEIRMTTDYGELLSTCSDSINLSTVTAPLNVTIGTGLAGVVGRRIILASAADTGNRVTGTVTAYNSGSGATTIGSIVINGTVTRSDWNVGLTTYIDATGSMIKLANGDLLKSCWLTTSTGLSAVVYKSTAASNGAAWTFLSSILVDPINGVDETCITQLPDGRVIAYMRCNSLQIVRVRISSDFGATWGSTINTNIPGQGKTSIACSDSILCGITRDPVTARTLYFYCDLDSDFSTYTVGFLDARTKAYMYGDVLFNGTDFIATYSVEAEGSILYQGPTVVIRKVISLTAVAPPTVYDVDYQSMIDYATAGGLTLPSDATKLIHSNALAALRTAELIDEADSIYLPMANDVAAEQFYRKNVRKAWQTSTPVDTPTYAANGYDFNGTSEYVILATALSNLAKFTRNNASVVYYTADDVQGNPAFGVGNGNFSTRTDGTFLNPRNNSNLLFYSINGGALQSVANASSTGLYILKRLNSTTIEIWKDTGSGPVLLHTATVSSTGVATHPLHMSAEKFQDMVTLFSPRNFGFVMIGSAMPGSESEIGSIFYTMKTALGV